MQFATVIVFYDKIVISLCCDDVLTEKVVLFRNNLNELHYSASSLLKKSDLFSVIMMPCAAQYTYSYERTQLIDNHNKNYTHHFVKINKSEYLKLCISISDFILNLIYDFQNKFQILSFAIFEIQNIVKSFEISTKSFSIYIAIYDETRLLIAVMKNGLIIFDYLKSFPSIEITNDIAIGYITQEVSNMVDKFNMNEDYIVYSTLPKELKMLLPVSYNTLTTDEFILKNNQSVTNTKFFPELFYAYNNNCSDFVIKIDPYKKERSIKTFHLIANTITFCLIFFISISSFLLNQQILTNEIERLEYTDKKHEIEQKYSDAASMYDKYLAESSTKIATYNRIKVNEVDPVEYINKLRNDGIEIDEFHWRMTDIFSNEENTENIEILTSNKDIENVALKASQAIQNNKILIRNSDSRT